MYYDDVERKVEVEAKKRLEKTGDRKSGEKKRGVTTDHGGGVEKPCRRA